MIKKISEVKVEKPCRCDREKIREEIKNLLIKKAPDLFDRHPEITGDIGKMVDEIINLIK